MSVDVLGKWVHFIVWCPRSLMVYLMVEVPGNTTDGVSPSTKLGQIFSVYVYFGDMEIG